MLKKTIYTLIIVLMIVSFAFSQENKNTSSDKFTTVNVIISSVYFSSMGLIVEYYSGGKIRQTYIPYKFVDEMTAVIIPEDNTNISPQMNIVYKNLEPFKVKIYIPKYPIGYGYNAIEFLTDEIKNKFNSTDKLIFIFSDEGEKK